MESVIQRIRQARDEEKNQRIETNVAETTIDGCQVKMRFDASSDDRAMDIIQSMLISAHMDALLMAASGGE